MSLDKNATFVCHSDEKRTGAVALEAEKGAAKSLKALYEKHGAALAAYACCCGLDFASAEDVVQQVFLKLLRGESRPAQAPLAYLYRAVRNAGLNYQRARRREAPFPEGELCFGHPTADAAEVLSLQIALRELPEEQRETVFFRIWSGMTLQEIADMTETPLNTVASRYRYALEKLRAQLGTPPGRARSGHA
ncbi:MAG TPA: RNA polymerase sigma factor [Candidatus Limnocylindrales bacterium]|nr:RNA polymerase sigma factor [Candidatus Limnocylindrales bacterium]